MRAVAPVAGAKRMLHNRECIWPDLSGGRTFVHDVRLVPEPLTELCCREARGPSGERA